MEEGPRSESERGGDGQAEYGSLGVAAVRDPGRGGAGPDRAAGDEPAEPLAAGARCDRLPGAGGSLPALRRRDQHLLDHPAGDARPPRPGLGRTAAPLGRTVAVVSAAGPNHPLLHVPGTDIPLLPGAPEEVKK